MKVFKSKNDEKEKKHRDNLIQSIKEKQNQTKHYSLVPDKEAKRIIFKISDNNKWHSKVSVHLHPFDNQAYMSKLEINSIKIEKTEEIKMKWTSKQLQIATKQQQENNAIYYISQYVKA